MEVFHRQDFAGGGVAAMGDLLPMPYDVEVIALQIGLIDPIHVEKAARQFMEEFCLAVIVNAFMPVFAQTRFQRHQAVAVEMAQHPSVQY